MIIRGTEYSESYPYLDFARKNNLDYGRVLMYADQYLFTRRYMSRDETLIDFSRRCFGDLSTDACMDIEMITRTVLLGELN